MRQVEVGYNHRPQREDFSINAGSRPFSLAHDAHSGSEVHPPPAKAGLRRFVEVRPVAPLMKTSCSMAPQQEDFRLPPRRTSVWRSYFTYSRTPTSNLFQSRRFGRVSVSLAEPRARDLLCWRREDDLVTVTADWKVSCWRCATVTN